MQWVLLALVAAGVVVAAMADREGRLRGFTTPFRSRRYARRAALAAPGPADAGRRPLGRRRAAVDVWPQALSPVAQARYSERWRRIQLRFVYEPAEAVREADDLVDEVLRRLGYQPDAVDPRDAEVPVAPELLADYVARSFHRAGRSDTDVAGLREAFVRDRALFDQLLAANE